MTALLLRCLTLTALLFAAACGGGGGGAVAPAIQPPAPAETLTIVVTDSGLGGLSVAADIARRNAETGAYRRVDVIFYNALFDAETGYNSLTTREEKVRIFNNALTDMGTRYAPDYILVACNTLSVLLPDCEFARRGTVPVVGIVEPGVALIREALEADPTASVILFATPTTIDEDSHRAGLLAAGIAPQRVVTQPCRDLTFYIEQDFEGFDTELMIGSFVDEAAGRLGEPRPKVYASFNCTHFGYSSALWTKEMQRAGLEVCGLLDPNKTMADFLFPPVTQGRFAEPEATIRFVTMVPISRAAVESISRAVRPVSPLAAAALEKYELIPDLFRWKE
jgi:glutamate racemase